MQQAENTSSYQTIKVLLDYNNKRKAFSVLSVPRCYKQNSLKNELVSGWSCEWSDVN
jgi:hypothetical protein